MICKNCIMDSTDPDLVIDDGGVCNHCHLYSYRLQKRVPLPAERDTRLDNLISEIKKAGAGNSYDCVIGVSGGVDSTYLAYLTHQFGLRPLAVHFDNGWNSELAVSNIEKTLKKLKIDLITEVIDWEVFKDLQLSFLKASTPDGEVPTDHAIVALLYKIAIKYGIKHILLGTNVSSESVMPLKWGYGYSDYRYIKSVHDKFGKVRLRNYPHYSLIDLFVILFIRKVKMVSFLDFIEYKKEAAMELIQDRLGWVYYGGKHYESIYTRFYQSYVLPKKFGIDKRRAHFSNLIMSGQLSRSKALEMMNDPICDPKMMEQDKSYVIKKLDLTNEEFESIMQLPPQTFLAYPNSYGLTHLAKKIMKLTRLG